MGFTPVAYAAVTGLITFGTITSLFNKIIYDMKGIGPDGKEHYFRKPWAMALVMFIGMSCCLPLAYAQKAKRKRKGELTEPLLEAAEAPKEGQASELKKVLMLMIPTVFDLIATVLMNVGLLSVTASVYQMMRGAEMLFAALFAVLFLGRRLNSFHYGGIVCCTVGICMVGVSSVLSGEGSQTMKVSSAQMVAGMLLIVASQCVQAAQITFEDFFMTDMNIAPLMIVGYEGVFGCLMMVAVMMPLANFLPGEEGHGLHEESLHTIYILAHNPHILGTVLFMAFALLMYNISGMNVTGELGAVFRTVLETMRTLFVWIIDLILHEGLGLQIGESWSNWSYLQLAGFIFLVSGTIIYGKGDDKEMLEYAAEAVAAEAGEGGGAGGETGAMAVPGAGTTPMTIHASSVSKATMNINQFAGSLRAGSMTASSLTHRFSSSSVPRV